MTAKDIISRDTLKQLTSDLAYHILQVHAETIELLETQHQRIEDRRADLVARMRGRDGEEGSVLILLLPNRSNLERRPP